MILSVCVIRYRSALYKIILGSKKFVVSQRNGGRKRRMEYDGAAA